MKIRKNEYLKGAKNKHFREYEKFFSKEILEEVLNYHKSFPMYEATPLCSMNSLAEKFGVKKILLKDEAFRFGLNAFKVLGGSYAIAKVLERKFNFPILNYQTITNPQIASELEKETFITATDGNHGRGIAWTSKALGSKAIVLMPHGSSKERLENIKKEDAQAWITDLNYDDTVRMASEIAEENGYILIQDTAWNGYEQIPNWIMQGYTTILQEVMEQSEEMPTHVFVQAGVGSFAAAVAGFFKTIYGEKSPQIIVVESSAADCLYQSACNEDGSISKISGDLHTIMAGLACGEPSTEAWKILRECADFFISCEDFVAADAMRILANPILNDQKITSGESGAAGIGACLELLETDEVEMIKEELGLDNRAKILAFLTEGITDKENYEKVVWYGKYNK